MATAALGLPIYPVAVLHATPQPAVNYDAGETVGWPAFARQVAAVYNGLPGPERRTAVLLAGNYGEAGALDHYGPTNGLPPVYSGHLSYWRWGPPPADASPVLVVGYGWDEAELRRECTELTHAARSTTAWTSTTRNRARMSGSAAARGVRGPRSGPSYVTCE